MPTTSKRLKNKSDHPEKLTVLNLRHSQSVKDFVQTEAAENNEFPGAVARRIFNAGLKQIYGVKLKNNKIITPPPPR